MLAQQQKDRLRSKCLTCLLYIFGDKYHNNEATLQGERLCCRQTCSENDDQILLIFLSFFVIFLVRVGPIIIILTFLLA